MSALGIKVKERLLLFIKYNGLSNLAFEKACGLSNGYIRNFKGNLGNDKLANILSAFPKLSKEWLLYGEGEMLVGQQEFEIPTEVKPTSDNSLLEYLQRKIAELEGKIDKLNEEKADLLQENAVLRYENSMLTPRKGDAEDAAGSLSASAV